MSLHFFVVPALDPAAAQDEFNRFCAGRCVVSVERQFVADGQASFWALCVTVASGPGPLPDALKSPEQRGAKSKVDYKEVLSEAEFARYADLRAWRKATAEREGVPVYAVFSNEQLAEMVRRGVDLAAARAVFRWERVCPRKSALAGRGGRQAGGGPQRLRRCSRPYPTACRPGHTRPHPLAVRSMDQALPPVRQGASRGGKPQGARGVGRPHDGILRTKTPRVVDFFRVPR